MFYLRPHGRRHERVSQEESEAADTINSSSDNNNNNHSPIRQSDLQSALAAAGIESIHNQPSAPSAAVNSLSGDNPAATTAANLNNNDPSNITDDSLNPPPPPASASASASASSEREADQYYHSAATAPSEPSALSPFAEHYERHPTMIRTSPTCFLIICFFLLRLWIEAIIEKDIGLIFISLMGSTWCYRWYALRREAERVWMEPATDNELTIEEGGGGANNTATIGNRSGADAAVDFDPDLGLVSFQAQLAMAILESQRQMFENGGYGGNDHPSSDNGPGVTDEAKQSWTRVEWGKCDETTEKLRAVIQTKTGGEGGDYGSVSMEDKDNNPEVQSVSSSQLSAEMMNENSTSSSSLSKLEEGGLLVKSLDEEEPSCSICLCEYENGETVTKLPCNHIYHESCLSSWTESHVRCPLCNYDLMTGFEQPESVRNQQNNEADQLAFRNMALSALGGRRVRARVRSSSRRSNPGGGWSSLTRDIPRI
eukprot:CAMPEP_0201691386 /NCGR_PEP_ID=MMETSP0578-20130828/4557_1 /ASSEMBLY_ACC=CAM_ASM_000663 /TAXON_ID=267565 /ORGANISM="Skeletonema grethea, Strain CCMP 1804" /LENGTH=484 /DNA_ID=CAMNT_0048176577 /DNA_START=43 /DNA_END=1497 /DNA_ORIENTATION=+